MTLRSLCLISVSSLVVGVPSASATSQELDETNVTSFSLEDLLSVEVTSVSKKREKQTEAAAAVFVIDETDIRRSGATTLPEILRMVPGMEVAQINSNNWAVSARGFNERFANKLLVLLDGRTLYSPIFSGTYWDVQDILLDDIQAIEVIRGPGASMWGANAVNGVINIKTKKASETTGSLAHLIYEEGGDITTSIRHGGKIGDNSHLRVSLKARSSEDMFATSHAGSNWQGAQANMRYDYSRGANSFFGTAQIYQTENGAQDIIPQLIAPYNFISKTEDDQEGAHILGRWERKQSGTKQSSLQFFWDYANREVLGSENTNHVFDIEFQQNLLAADKYDVVWGLGYRYIMDEVSSGLTISVANETSERDIINGFVQTTFAAFTDNLDLTIGTKFEHNDYSGFEVQPSVRFAWSKSDVTLWGAVSRSVRTPSRGETNMNILMGVLPPMSDLNPGPFPSLIEFFGDPSMKSEEVVSYELGLKNKMTSKAILDVTVFYNDYENLVGSEALTPIVNLLAPVPHVLLPVSITNTLEAETYGAEISIDWIPTSGFKLESYLSYLETDISESINGLLSVGSSSSQDAPKFQASTRASIDITDQIALDIWARYVDDLEGIGVDDYTDLDVRLAWSPNENVEFSVVGQNLLDDQRSEFRSGQLSVVGGEVSRSVYAAMRISF